MKKFLIILLPAFFWASSDIITRFTSSKLNTIVGTFLLSLGMTIAMVIAILFIPNVLKEIPKTSSKYALVVFSSGLVNAVAWYFYFDFLKDGGNFTQGFPLMMVYLTIFAAIFGIIFFKDPLTIKTGIGLILGIGAIYFLAH